MKRNLVTSLLVGMFLGSVALAWNPLATHRWITRDALDDIGSVYPDEFPDLLAFRAPLISGSGTEAHNPPGVKNDEHRWWPEEDDWWGRRVDDKNDPETQCALEYLEVLNVYRAYLTIGFIMHNTQDRKVPSHRKQCIHGTVRRPDDDLEFYVSWPYNHGYVDGDPDVCAHWVDSEGQVWSYWLGDNEDDDTGDDRPDSVEDDWLVDHGGDYKSEWGIGTTEFGTYGFSHTDRLPGLNQGEDNFWEVPNGSCAKQYLYQAYVATSQELMWRSVCVPPVIVDVWPFPRMLGPEKPVAVLFNVYENRKPRVFLDIRVENIPIQDTAGKSLDAGGDSARDLRLCLQAEFFPWVIDDMAVEWAGSMHPGVRLGDGLHTVKIRVKDCDGNWSQTKEFDIAYDGTAPIVSEM